MPLNACHETSTNKDTILLCGTQRMTQCLSLFHMFYFVLVLIACESDTCSPKRTETRDGGRCQSYIWYSYVQYLLLKVLCVRRLVDQPPRN